MADSEYLARIIFEEMIGRNKNEETGYGIGTQLHGDTYRLITVDCKKQTVKVEHVNYSPKVEWKGTFEKFLTHKFKEEL